MCGGHRTPAATVCIAHSETVLRYVGSLVGPRKMLNMEGVANRVSDLIAGELLGPDNRSHFLASCRLANGLNGDGQVYQKWPQIWNSG